MPLYEYKCNSCGKNFEVLQKFSAAPLDIHAECGGGPVERLISPPAFQFKGTGWYVTDYAKGSGAANGGSKPGESGSDSKATDSKGSESKSSESKSSDGGSSSKSESSSASSSGSGESKSSGSSTASPAK